MFRAERPQAGRYREFEQIGAEYIGNSAPAADAEVILMLKDIVQQFGAKNYRVKINSLGCDKCRALYRWRIKKGVSFEHAAKVVIRIFNRKYYDIDGFDDFTWSRWFFPVLTTDRGLKELDAYLLENLRYIYSGRHYKGNYAVTYEKLKSLGYRSLVHEYYAFRKNEDRENET